MSALNLAPHAVAQPRPNLIASTVCDDTTLTPLPASFNDPLHVLVPHQPSLYWTFDDWPADHGATLPAAGTEVLIATAFNAPTADGQSGGMWLVRWKGSFS